jgi:TolA-binding protein
MAITVNQIIPAPGPNTKAVAIVEMGDGTEQQIQFWPELAQQWGGSATDPTTALGAYIVACALWAAGRYAEALQTLQPFVQGDNWAARWIAEHPDPGPYGAPVPY